MDFHCRRDQNVFDRAIKLGSKSCYPTETAAGQGGLERDLSVDNDARGGCSYPREKGRVGKTLVGQAPGA